jgi:hypothetical protein
MDPVNYDGLEAREEQAGQFVHQADVHQGRAIDRSAEVLMEVQHRIHVGQDLVYLEVQGLWHTRWDGHLGDQERQEGRLRFLGRS